MSLTAESSEKIRTLVEAAREARLEGLVVSTSGNISVRLQGASFAISAARSRLGHLRRDEVLVVDEKGQSLPGLTGAHAEMRVSRETPMHRAIYQRHGGVKSVLHCQSPAATILACRKGEAPDLDFIPEIPVYVGQVGVVPYLPPGGQDLADAVARSLDDPEVGVVQLQNHGQVAVGDSPAAALERAVFFEFACRLFVMSSGHCDLGLYEKDDLAVLRSYGSRRS